MYEFVFRCALLLSYAQSGVSAFQSVHIKFILTRPLICIYALSFHSVHTLVNFIFCEARSRVLFVCINIKIKIVVISAVAHVAIALHGICVLMRCINAYQQGLVRMVSITVCLAFFGRYAIPIFQGIQPFRALDAVVVVHQHKHQHCGVKCPNQYCKNAFLQNMRLFLNGCPWH